jgi:hypothetical protein
VAAHFHHTSFGAQDTDCAVPFETSGSDGTLGIQTFEVADQQTEVTAGREARATDLVGVESLTERLDVTVEVRVVEDLIEWRVERVRGAARQMCRSLFGAFVVESNV